MNRMVSLVSCTVILAVLGAGVCGRPLAGMPQTGREDAMVSGGQTPLTVRVSSKDRTVIFQLNQSIAARELYGQLPVTVRVEDYGSNEKIFYPPKKLNTKAAPGADARAGTLAYYAPWGDVVMFYEDFGSASGLYELGHALSGAAQIKYLSGTINVEKYLP